MINEGYDPDVARDMEVAFDRLVPHRGRLTGTPKEIPIRTSRPRWSAHRNRLDRRWPARAGALAGHFLRRIRRAAIARTAREDRPRSRELIRAASRVRPAGVELLLAMTLGVYIQVPFCQTKCTYCNFHTGVVSRDRYAPYARGRVPRNRLVGSAERRFESAPDRRHRLFRRRHAEPARSRGAREDSRAAAAAFFKRCGAWRSRWKPIPKRSRRRKRPRGCGRFQPHQPGRRNRLTIASCGPPAGCIGARIFSRRRISSRRWVSQYQHGLDRRAAASDARIVGRFGERASANSPGAHLRFTCSKSTRAAGWARNRSPAEAATAPAAIPERRRNGGILRVRLCAPRRRRDTSTTKFRIGRLPGRRSRHNLKYWRREPYLGFGAGAHSFDGRTRWANVHDSARYVELHRAGNFAARANRDGVTAEQALEEEFFLGLAPARRHRSRAHRARLRARSCADRSRRLRGRIAGLRSLGLRRAVDGTRLRLAPDRLTVSNEVFVELLG